MSEKPLMMLLGDLGVLDRGRSRHRPRYAKYLYGGKYPFVQTGDIKSSGGRITTFTQTYSEAGLEQSRLWDTGTLCITIAANIAETAILSFPACFPDSIVGFTANKEQCDTQYIEYTFRYLRQKIQGDASGSAQDNINLEYLRKLPVPIWSISKQKAISHILGSLDEKIELNKRTNKTLEGIATALFKSWFIDFDPVTAKAEGHSTAFSNEISELFPDSFEDSELGEIPSGWSIKSLDEIADFLNGLASQKYPPKGELTDLPVIKIAQLRKGNTLESDQCSDEIGEEYVIEDGDILFSWSGSLLVDLWTGGVGALNQHLFKVTSDRYQKWFFYYWTKHHLQEFKSIAKRKATTMGHIQRRHLSEAKVLIPSSECLTKISTMFGSILERQINIRLESRTLTQLRDALLPKLISGKLKLPDAEKMLEEVGI